VNIAAFSFVSKKENNPSLRLNRIKGCLIQKDCYFPSLYSPPWVGMNATPMHDKPLIIILPHIARLLPNLTTEKTTFIIMI